MDVTLVSLVSMSRSALPSTDQQGKSIGLCGSSSASAKCRGLLSDAFQPPAFPAHRHENRAKN
jgi:hypothetical protein